MTKNTVKWFLIDRIKLAHEKLMLDNVPGARVNNITSTGTRMMNIIFLNT